VPDRPHVHVRLAALEFLLRHFELTSHQDCAPIAAL